MKESKSIKVGISVGDLGGIGAEIVLKTFQDKRMFDQIIPVLYCSQDAIKQHQKKLHMDGIAMQVVESASKARPQKLNLVAPWKATVEIAFGNASVEMGNYAFMSLEKAVEDLARNEVDVLVTAPINKYTLQSEKFTFPGHTEYLANYSNADNHLMVLVHDNLRVAVVTGHIPLSDVSKSLTLSLVLEKIQLLNSSLQKDFGINRPKIAVLGLNPHAGENGLLGKEEQEIIEPAIEQAQNDNILCYGPFPSDGLFGSSGFKKFDGILAMYHDQGLTPFKALAFEAGVNYTAGLPVVRTSPDHGTAYDLAGKGQASPESFRQAVFLACDVFKSRMRTRTLTANPLPVNTEKP